MILLNNFITINSNNKYKKVHHKKKPLFNYNKIQFNFLTYLITNIENNKIIIIWVTIISIHKISYNLWIIMILID